MHTRRDLIRVTQVLVFVAVTGTALAQSAPRAIDPGITSSNAPLDQEQSARVDAWAQFWAGRLTGPDSTPEQVEEARRELLAPLSPLNRPSDLFRGAYSRAVVRPLRDAIKGEEAHAVANAIITLSQLGSDQSLDLLVEHCDRRDEKRDSIRLLAAKGAYVTLQQAAEGRHNAVNPRSIAAAVRALRDAAQNEENPLILRYLLQGMLAARDQTSRQHYVAAVKSIAQGLNQQQRGPSPLMQPVYLSLADLRNQFLPLQATEKRALGQELGPVLGRVLQACLLHWADVQAMPATREFYGRVVRASEVFLGVIDGEVRGADQVPRTRLSESWQAGDREAFERDLNRWLQILGQPPYKN